MKRRTERRTASACSTSNVVATGSHVAAATLGRYLAGELPASEDAAVEQHLLACPACETALCQLLPSLPASSSAPVSPDAQPVRRFLDRTGTDLAAALAQRAVERREAEDLWRRLERYGSELRHNLVRNSRCYHNRGLFELLLEKGLSAKGGDPGRREEMLRLALEVVERLDPAVYGRGSVEAARARAWGSLGATLLASGDLAQADEILDVAASCLADSWHDPLDEAFLLEQRAALRRAQHRLPEAVVLLEAALAILREVNETHAAGKLLHIEGQVLEAMSDPAGAAEAFGSCLSHLDGLRAPELVVASHLGLVSCLLDSGQADRAETCFPAARRSVEEVGSRADRLRLLWLEGRAAALLRQAPNGEPALREALAGLREEGPAFDAALVGLDLAALYARQGRTTEMRQTAAEIFLSLRPGEIHSEALAALSALDGAAESERLEAELIEATIRFLRNLVRDPTLKLVDARELLSLAALGRLAYPISSTTH